MNEFHENTKLFSKFVVQQLNVYVSLIHKSKYMNYRELLDSYLSLLKLLFTLTCTVEAYDKKFYYKKLRPSRDQQ